MKSRYNTLKTLHLAKVTIDPGALECIMANCLNLESLVIKSCTLSSELCIRHPQLKDLSVLSCTSFETIELHAGNLTRFEFIALTLGQLYFHHVPLLEFFSLKLHGEILMQFLFGELESEELSVVNMFSNLRRLDLRIYNLPGQLLDAPVLDLCPLLEELNITSIHAGTLQKKAESRVFDEEQMKKRSVNFHTNLKKVGLSGFSRTTSEIEFALYILRSAIALDQMYISCYYKDFFAYGYTYCGLPWTEDKIKKMHQLFQGHAISGSAKIIFSLPI